MMLKSFSPGLQVLFFIFLMILTSFIGEKIFQISLFAIIDTEVLEHTNWGDPRMTIAYVFFSQVFYFLLSFLLFLRLTGHRFEALVKITRIKLKPLLITLVVLIGLFLVSPILTYINEFIRPILPPVLLDKEAATVIIQKELFYQDNFIQFGFGLIVFAVLPAIFEELVFRGFLINKMLASGMGEIGAILMSAAIFAISHLQPLSFLVMLAAGICLGFVYLKFKNIKYSMLLHFLFNGVQIVIGYLVGTGVLEIDL